MLNYIAAMTQKDILFATHQCAHFSNRPMRVQEIAIKQIVQYLKSTHTKGYIINPSVEKWLDCYVDANFAGMWSPDQADDPSSIKSRTGYVTTFTTYLPSTGVSKLQTKITLSTTEAEYIALSQALRDIIPMQALLKELRNLRIRHW